MKKYLTTPKYKRINITRAKNRLKRKLKSKLKQKNKRRSYLGLNRVERQILKEFNFYGNVKAPDCFSFIKNPSEVITFIKRIEKFRDIRKKIFVNVKHLKELDHSALTVLLSIMITVKAKRIRFNGNFPKDKVIKQTLIDSDFFKYINKEVSDKVEYTIGKENQIFTKANKSVISELGIEIIKDASNTIWGSSRRCPGVQRTLVELMQNTIDHASPNKDKRKHWWLSVNHDKENKKVAFTFVDYGIGIFKSLHQKKPEDNWYQNVKEFFKRFSYSNNAKLLKAILNGELHRSSTRKESRGKGLPGIKQCLERRQINELHVITNDVFANVSSDDFKILEDNFNGTFVYWELNNENDNKPWVS